LCGGGEQTLVLVLLEAQPVADRDVFGTLRQWGHDHFLMRGLAKVRAEFSLSALIYNLRRVLNLRSVEQLLAVLRSPAAN